MVGIDNEDSSTSIEALADNLDSMLETWTSPKLIMDFLTQHAADAVEVIHASLLSDRMFNLDFILKTNPGYASFLLKFLPKLDPYTRTHCIWQTLQCTKAQWAAARFFEPESSRLRELARQMLTPRDMSCHPYTGSATSWLEPFDDCFFSARSVDEASSSIPDKCFAEFGRYVQHSLWLGRIYQSDFFAISSLAKQVHMHSNLDKIPVLLMLKFVAQILHSGLDPNVKLAFWKKANSVEMLGDAKTLHSSEAVAYLSKRCCKCRPLFEAMFQFPLLYDKLYEAKYEQQSAACFDWLDAEDEESLPLARQLINKHSSYEEVAVNLTLCGESLSHEDVEYMLTNKKFNMVGEMVKGDLDLVLEVLSPVELFFLVMKYVKQDLCLECLEALEAWKPGFVSGIRDCYGNNALWFLLHRKIVADPNYAAKQVREGKQKSFVKRHVGDLIKNVLIEKYHCDPDEENVYGLSWNKVSKMPEFVYNDETTKTEKNNYDT